MVSIKEVSMNAKMIAVAAAALLLMAGCGQQASTGRPPGGARAQVITIKGSDTMVILCQRWAETYMHHKPGVTVQVTGGGSGTGIAALINGGTDICAASRPMKDKEKVQIKTKHGKDAHEISVALDGLTVYVNESNPVEQLSLSALDLIYRAQTTDWKDVGAPHPSLSPGGRGWGEGAGKIVCYGRENSSGTYAYFKEHVLKDKDFATEVQSLPGTAAIINAVMKDKSAIGYGGKGYAAKGVKIVPICAKDGEKGILPTIENVVSNTYPISRSLFFYTVGQPGGEVKVFVEWVLGDEGQKVCDQVGYYPLPKK